MVRDSQFVLWLDEVTESDRARVGPKNSALANIPRAHAWPSAGPRWGIEPITIPEGFVVTTDAFHLLLESDAAGDRIATVMKQLGNGLVSIAEAAGLASELIAGLSIPIGLEREIHQAFDRIEQRHGPEALLAVRSSASMEDLPGATFAGQYDTVLGIRGFDELRSAYLSVVASLFGERVLSYHSALGSDPIESSMAVGVQRLIRSDLGAAGVVLTTHQVSNVPSSDPEARRSSTIEAAVGLGASLAGGEVDPDIYHVSGDLVSGHLTIEIEQAAAGNVSSRVLTDAQVGQLHLWALRLERFIEYPVDMEWALDGTTGELVVVQVRPAPADAPGPRANPSEQSSSASAGEQPGPAKHDPDSQLATGLGIGVGQATGRPRILHDPLDDREFDDGDILVTETTSPQWLPLMLRAGALVTDHGGRTSHAAIVCRELGLLAVVGCGDATTRLEEEQNVEIFCDERGLGSVSSLGGGARSRQP